MPVVFEVESCDSDEVPDSFPRIGPAYGLRPPRQVSSSPRLPFTSSSTCTITSIAVVPASTQRKIVRVFISSTFLDMQEERDYLVLATHLGIWQHSNRKGSFHYG